MSLFFWLTRCFVLLGVFKHQTVTSDNIFDKSVLTLQQILKRATPSSSVPSANLKARFLNRISMKDISKALNAVSNDPRELQQLIPKMFDLRSPNPAYIFSLPQGTRRNFITITMHRDDFEEPIFPNLTTSYVHLMRSKDNTNFNAKSKNNFQANNNIFEERVNSNFVEEDEPTLVLNLQTERNFIEFINKVNQLDEPAKDKKEGESDEWSLLGLHGWQGIISKHTKEKQHSLRVNENEPYSNKSNEIETQEWDLPGKMREQFLDENLLRAMEMSKFIRIVENLTQQSTYPITSMHGSHADTDVYIGRVNDPFGHSTKWNEKNSSADPLMEARTKRGVIELYSMIKCSTGCDPLIFKGYGCYCGFLGDGIPVDGIDRCCRLHDKCYEYSNCISYLEYFVPYIWKCYRGKPLCAIDHGEWGGPYSCAARLCHCDLSLSRCLRRFLCPHRRNVCRTSNWRILQNFLLNF